MLSASRVLATLLLPVSFAASHAVAQHEPPVTTDHAIVVSVHHEATDAGVAILKQGGNAVDAAVATGFALAVVHPVAGNIGGGGFMLVHLAKPHGGKNDLFIDSAKRRRAPLHAICIWTRIGMSFAGASTLGYKSVAVPGSVAGLAYAEKNYGKLGLKAVMVPAIKLAEDGFVLSKEEAEELHDSDLAKYPDRTGPFNNRREAPITDPAAHSASPSLPSRSSALPRIPATSITAKSRRSSLPT